ncbi:MAG: winged helix-turn-helix domain-containing protein [Alphaproteobacteria bacterium]
MLRRGPRCRENVLKAGTLEINRLTRQVKRDGKDRAQPQGILLLEYLFLHSGPRVVAQHDCREDLGPVLEGLTNIVDVYIGHLRRKIDEGFEPKLIRTVRGLGYTLDTEQVK